MHKSLIISSVEFSAPLKYSEGHTLSANEAAALNALFHKEVSEKMKRKVADAQKASPGGLSPESLQSLHSTFAAICAEHDFAPKTPTNTFDPVETEAIKLALPSVKKALLKKGIDLSSLSPDKLQSLTLQAINRYPSFREEAKRRVENLRAIAGKVLEIPEQSE